MNIENKSTQLPSLQASQLPSFPACRLPSLQASQLAGFPACRLADLPPFGNMTKYGLGDMTKSPKIR
jgi:hypothetical protein